MLATSLSGLKIRGVYVHLTYKAQYGCRSLGILFRSARHQGTELFPNGERYLRVQTKRIHPIHNDPDNIAIERGNLQG